MGSVLQGLALVFSGLSDMVKAATYSLGFGAFTGGIVCALAELLAISGGPTSLLVVGALSLGGAYGRRYDLRHQQAAMLEAKQSKPLMLPPVRHHGRDEDS